MVMLQVFPADAWVVHRGASRQGPQVEFEVARGEKVVLEIARTGYVPRRVVLNGSESKVVVGLVKEDASFSRPAASP